MSEVVLGADLDLNDNEIRNVRIDNPTVTGTATFTGSSTDSLQEWYSAEGTLLRSVDQYGSLFTAGRTISSFVAGSTTYGDKDVLSFSPSSNLTTGYTWANGAGVAVSIPDTLTATSLTRFYTNARQDSITWSSPLPATQVIGTTATATSYSASLNALIGSSNVAIAYPLAAGGASTAGTVTALSASVMAISLVTANTTLTVTDLRAISASGSVQVAGADAAKVINVTNYQDIVTGGGYLTGSTGTNAVTITNYYGLRLKAPAAQTGNVTIANRYGVYQEDATASNVFAGSTTINNSLIVAGDLTINGTTTTVNSTVTTLDDPIITLGGDTAPTSDDSKDRGVEFRWHDGSSAKVGFFGFDDSTGKFTFIPDAANTSEVFAGTKGTIDAYFSGSDISSGLVSATYGGTGVDNSGKTITLGGNLTTTGAFATTLTVTADTNVTLPTTGTLVTSTDLAAKVTGPASATDNALVRFDSTTGKLVQDSALRVDDFGRFIDNGIVVKATPRFEVVSTNTTKALLGLDTTGVGERVLQFTNTGVLRWDLGANNAAESGSTAGSDFQIRRYTDAGALIDSPLSIIRQTGWAYFSANVNIAGATTLSGDLTMSKAAPRLVLNSPTTDARYIRFNTNANYRWAVGANSTTESGSNVGSDFVVSSFADNSGVLSTPLTITRSTGAIALAGDLTISKATATFNITSTSGDAYSRISRLAGNGGYYEVHTGGVRRWVMGANTSAESGSNLGSNFAIYAYDDAGSLLSTPLSISRYNGATTLSGDLTIGKSDARLTVDSTANDGYVNIQALANKYAGVIFRTGSSPRWGIVKSNYGEPGSNVGSDLLISRYTDAGAWIGNNISIERANGRVTLYDSGATAGLALGSNGPRMMSGTGSPEGVVTAPIGSIWFQSDSTVGVTHWIKATGTGNTGWVVQYGDTGLRNLSGVTLLNSWTIYSSVFNLRRVGNLVEVNLWADKTSASADSVYTIPSGFRPAVAYARFTQATNVDDDYCRGYIMSTGDFRVLRSTMTGAIPYIYLTYVTSDAWPASLPGSAA